jgi:prepilin-type N-terminal cleavage/methylation domain-containing protein
MVGELAPRLQGPKGEKGFTLVELLVVIVIIGILAAVAVFAVGGITDKGEEAACDATANSVRTASESYRAQNDAYAGSLADLDPDFIRLDDLTVAGNIITVEGGTVTYVPTGGGVTDTCDP